MTRRKTGFYCSKFTQSYVVVIASQAFISVSVRLFIVDVGPYGVDPTRSLVLPGLD